MSDEDREHTQAEDEAEPSAAFGPIMAPLSEAEEARLRAMLKGSRHTEDQEAAAYVVWAQLKAGYVFFPALRDGELAFGWDAAGAPHWTGDSALTRQLKKLGRDTGLPPLPSATEREIRRLIAEFGRLEMNEDGTMSSAGPALPDGTEATLRKRLEEANPGAEVTEGHVARLARIVARLMVSRESLEGILDGRVRFEMRGDEVEVRTQGAEETNG